MSEVEQKFLEALDKAMTYVDERMELFDKRMESLEQLHSNLMLAYAEMTTVVETIIHRLVEPSSEGEKEEFRKEIRQRQADMLIMIKEATVEAAKSQGIHQEVSSDST